MWAPQGRVYFWVCKQSGGASLGSHNHFRIFLWQTISSDWALSFFPVSMGPPGFLTERVSFCLVTMSPRPGLMLYLSQAWGSV